jgi:hypothetical protein
VSGGKYAGHERLTVRLGEALEREDKAVVAQLAERLVRHRDRLGHACRAGRVDVEHHLARRGAAGGQRDGRERVRSGLVAQARVDVRQRGELMHGKRPAGRGELGRDVGDERGERAGGRDEPVGGDSAEDVADRGGRVAGRDREGLQQRAQQ